MVRTDAVDGVAEVVESRVDELCKLSSKHIAQSYVDIVTVPAEQLFVLVRGDVENTSASERETLSRTQPPATRSSVERRFTFTTSSSNSNTSFSFSVSAIIAVLCSCVPVFLKSTFLEFGSEQRGETSLITTRTAIKAPQLVEHVAESALKLRAASGANETFRMILAIRGRDRLRTERLLAAKAHRTRANIALDRDHADGTVRRAVDYFRFFSGNTFGACATSQELLKSLTLALFFLLVL